LWLWLHGALHIAIDLAKATGDPKGRSAAWLLVDQGLHVLVLAAVAARLGAAAGSTVDLEQVNEDARGRKVPPEGERRPKAAGWAVWSESW